MTTPGNPCRCLRWFGSDRAGAPLDAVRRLLTTVAVAVVAATAPAKTREVLAGPVPATVVAVIDGDTLAVRARVWLGQDLETHVRLADIDTPELRGDCPAETALAERARDALAALVADGPVVLTDIRYGTYAGRVVARVATADGVDAGAPLLAAGLARPYAGRGPRPDWCGTVAAID